MTFMPVTPESEDGQIIFNALGLRYATRPYRKHFVAPSDGPTRIACERMVLNGWMVPHGPSDINGMQCFHVTQVGAEAIGWSLP